MEISLCILTHNNPHGVYRLVDSIKAFRGFDVCVVIGDNSSDVRDMALNSKLADVYLPVENKELWLDGFGAVKQKLAVAAPTSWIMVGDSDETWQQLLPDVDDAVGVSKTWMANDTDIVYHGRVFDKQRFRLIGIIHEELYNRRTRANWGTVVGRESFAHIEHHVSEQDPLYIERKKALYDNLVYRAYTQPEAHRGVSQWWITEYMPRRIAEGFTPMSFEEWQEKYAPVGGGV